MTTTVTRPEPPAAASIAPIIAAGAIVLSISFGVRSVFGGVLGPISAEFQWPTEIFALSLAIQNLVWGLAQPLFGAIADKYGDRRALVLGFVCYLAGMVICLFGTTPLVQHLGAGVLVGMGVAGTAFGLVLAVVGRASPPEKRSQNLGLVSALGSSGQVVLPIAAAYLTAEFDWRVMLMVMTVVLLPVIFCVPFLQAPAAAAPATSDQTPPNEEALGRIILQAFGYPSYLLLTLGFFVCGFHIAFIGVHFPNFVEHFCTATDMTAEELRGYGLQMIGVVGVMNIIGTLVAGQLGGWIPKPYVLSAIYALRALVIFLFISFPITPLSVFLFAVAIGPLWLSTVPLTSALVAGMFGARVMGTLYGFVFLSHQIGSFIGIWLGGYVFDVYNSYDVVWWAAIALGIFSAIVHLPVKERAYQRAAA